MQKKLFAPAFKYQLISLFVTVVIFLSVLQNSFALDRVREVTIGSEPTYRCDTKSVKFNPMDVVNGNQDIEWELDNGVCLAYMASSGVAVFTSRRIAASACISAARQVKAQQAINASQAAGVVISPDMAREMAKNATRCSAFVAAQSYAQAAACCGGVVATATAVGYAVAALAVIHEVAVEAQTDAHICGENWNVWYERSRGQEDPDDYAGIPNYPGANNDKMHIYGKGNEDRNVISYQMKLEDDYKNGAVDMERKITNKRYREYIYGGMEFDDKGTGSCKNPSHWSEATRIKILGYTGDRQRYYMRGPKLTSNYACGRFLLHRGSEEEKNSAKAAYECCKQRSQDTLCIEVGSEHQFCKIGERCKVRHVWYDIYSSTKVPNYICAKTYSVCPYNHPLGGGSEIAQYDEKYPSILTNHCQYLKHCAKIPNQPYIRTSNLDGGWISSACRDLKGDSQNNYSYNSDLVPTKIQNFSAPIAQCFKETFENMFINRAGDNICNDPKETPNSAGICVNSGNKFSKGEVIEGEESFFQTIQDYLRTSIKVAMSVAITIAGLTILLTGTPADKKTIIMFIIKLALVAYFALGDAWQSGFFDSISSISIDTSNIFMQIDEGGEGEDELKDGCQFPKYNHAWQEGDAGDKYENPSYPEGKGYLRIWDMLDCKVVRAIGLAPNASVPNLVYMSLAGLLSANLGFLGLIFFVGTFIFGFFLIGLLIRALHIFLIASIAITLLIYVSPITITTSLFKKTGSIFTQWWKNLIGFIMQPIILFAYLGILITIFEGTIMGDATFSGDGKSAPKEINCSTGNAENNSIYCIFDVKNIKTNNALAPIGVGLPMLVNINQEKVATIMKAAFLMFIFSKFLDTLTAFAQKLVGGVPLSSGSKDGMEMFGKAAGVANAARKRIAGGVRKHGMKIARGAGGAGKKAIGAISSKRNKPSSGVDSAGKSGDDSPSTPRPSPTSGGSPGSHDVGSS